MNCKFLLELSSVLRIIIFMGVFGKRERPTTKETILKNTTTTGGDVGNRLFCSLV
jgi:hypothetical protein